MTLNDKTLVRAIFLIAIALLFGTWSMRYNVGTFGRAEPGLFPLLVSGLLLLIGALTFLKARLTTPAPLDFRIKNACIVLGSLCGFPLISQYLNMTLGIVFLVFVSTWAGTSYSVVRNIKVCVGLVAIALALKFLLNVNLPLY